jgi:hypothetical protein
MTMSTLAALAALGRIADATGFHLSLRSGNMRQPADLGRRADRAKRMVGS